MFIEELVIDGFKSYATRTTVGPFDKRFTAISGMNGTGKSNILDSLCFVLGISNLSLVRAAKLEELVYKQGQAGVTKASVTVVFNNEDKSNSPVGYEMHDKITMTRQIIVGGRNRYILNSHNVQANQIQNLLHSVGLNVNNPHFLIMQGRITLVTKMNPQQTLSMIEEAAGTRMYESKKTGALRTLEKKQARVDEINKLLAEEITPTLQKLGRERTNYMLWVSNNNEIERLTRFCLAYEYCQYQGRVEGKNSQLQEAEALLARLVQEIQGLNHREKEINNDIQSRTESRDQQRGRELKKLEDEHTKVSNNIASSETKLKNKQSDLEAQVAARQKGRTHLDEANKHAANKKKTFDAEKAKFDKLQEDCDSVQKQIEKAEWGKQALIAGMSEQQAPDIDGDGKSLREQHLEVQTKLSEMDAELKKRQMSAAHLEQRFAATKQSVSQSATDGKRLVKEKASIEAVVAEKKTEISKLKFDPQQYAALSQKSRELEGALHQSHDHLETLRAQIGNLDFHYTDPHKGFDKSRVKGVVAKLFNIKQEFTHYHRALEVCAGGRLFFVVVDNEDTGKALLEKGQLRRRVTIIPLSKVADHSLSPNVVKQAKNVVPGADVQSALQIIGYDNEMQNAMKFVFGSMLVCDTPETAKQVTFHPHVRVKSVTRDGDVYDPAGTLTGGSAPKGGGILARLQQLAEIESKFQHQQQEYESLQTQLRKLQVMANKYDGLERDLKCKEHEVALIGHRIESSAHHSHGKALEDMTAQLEQCKAEIKDMPEEENRLKALLKQLEKDIKSLDNGREGRIAYLEKQITELKGSRKPRLDKLEKHREKYEQASVEYEVAKSEFDALEGQDQTDGSGSSKLTGEVEMLKKSVEEQREQQKEAASRLEAMKNELKQMDSVLNGLSEEFSRTKQEREEKLLEEKKVSNKVQQLQKDDQEAHKIVARMEQQYTWIEKEKQFFGKSGTDFDFEANSYNENKDRLDELNEHQKKLGKNINKKAMPMFEKAEQEYHELLNKRDIVLNDKKKIEQVIADLDEKKVETLRHAWAKVNKDFDAIFSTLLPQTGAKLEPPAGLDPSEGLEIKVAFNGIWKESLTELSGGQRSLLALSLVLALLKFKPAPMYILDEVDAALDLSHTQNIGHIIRHHFTNAQFIIVSLKDGMFNNANVLFRTQLLDGSSAVTRYAIREGDAPAQGEEKAKRARKA